MDFSQVVGLDYIKNHLLTTLKNDRIAHAQLFVGQSGAGLLPVAIGYAKEILCSQYEVGSEAHFRCSKNVERLSHPDLHFVYPVNTNESVKKSAVSDSFSTEWRDLFQKILMVLSFNGFSI